MKIKITGAIILLLVIIGAFFVKNNQTIKKVIAVKQTTTIKGFIGGEKIGLFDDPEIAKVVKDKYGLLFDYSKAGSLDMINAKTDNLDYLFPSSSTDLELFKQKNNSKIAKSQFEFNSPIVIYSWDIITDALIKQGIVKEVNKTYYIIDMKKMMDLLVQNKKWSDIGVDALYGNVSITSTDPTKSNSGNMFAGLVANMFNNGEVVNASTVNTVIPKVKHLFDKLGYLEPSSSDLFNSYLKTGVGSKPMAVGYENQIIEFASTYPAQWNQVKGKVRILYPAPTIWSSHPFIALNSKSTKAIDALSDNEVQQLAFKKHGFRTAIVGIENDTKLLTVSGIPGEITKTIPVPDPTTMSKIIAGLSSTK